MSDVRKKYFNWLIQKIDRGNDLDRYSQLLRELHRANFVWDTSTDELRMDENRAGDGLYLRYLFNYDTGLDIEGYFDEIGKPCSVLEMLIGLSMRIEDDIMGEGQDRYDIWFWDMMDNCGLSYFDIENWDTDEVRRKIDDILYRRYAKNGRGGLFIFKKNADSFLKDAREAEIWSQANAWINANFW